MRNDRLLARPGSASGRGAWHFHVALRRQGARRFVAGARGFHDPQRPRADRIFWDEPHWVHPEHFRLPDEHWGCHCEHCAGRFGRVLPKELDDEVLAFREECLVDFIGHLVDHVAKQGARPVVCLLPLTGGVQGISDWSRVASLPGLDTLCTDPYWKAFGEPAEPFVGEYAQRIAGLAAQHGVSAQLWIQGFRIEPGDADDIRAAVAAARAAGIEDLWTWAWEACAHMSALAGSDPAAVWEVLCDTLTS